MNEQPRESQIDDAIDRAVRDMMSVDAHRAFKGRVLSRLGEDRRPWLGSLRIAVAAAAVVALMLAMTIIRRVESPAPALVSKAPVQEVTPPAAQPRGGGPEQSESRVAVTTTSRAPLAGGSSGTRLTRRLEAANADALPDIPPLTVAELEPTSIEPAAIAIAPLDPIAEVHIAPLAAPLAGLEE